MTNSLRKKQVSFRDGKIKENKNETTRPGVSWAKNLVFLRKK